MNSPGSHSLRPQKRSWLLGLLGEHVQGSMTPLMHEAEARRQGLLLSYRTLDTFDMSPLALRGENAASDAVDWPRFIELAQQFTFDGLNITHPAKQAVQPALDDLSDEAELLGAVNTVAFRNGRAIGMNTDHSGFADVLVALGETTDLSNVVQLGAGGAGSAMAYALLQAGVERLTFVEVEAARAEATIARLSQAFDASRMRVLSPEEAPDAVRKASGLVNSTPIGMTGVSETSPIDVTALHPELWVADAVYRPIKTVLVRAAEAIGCRAFGGAEMVVGQAAAAFACFTGLEADRKVMYATFTARARELWGADAP